MNGLISDCSVLENDIMYTGRCVTVDRLEMIISGFEYFGDAMGSWLEQQQVVALINFHRFYRFWDKDL